MGRWAPQQSDDCLATSKSVVVSVQERVAQVLRGITFPLFDETETLKNLRHHLTGAGLNHELAETAVGRFDFAKLQADRGVEMAPHSESRDGEIPP